LKSEVGSPKGRVPNQEPIELVIYISGLIIQLGKMAVIV
jgi:hypothetical protein